MLVTLSSTTILLDRADQEGYPQKDRVSSQRSVELYAGWQAGPAARDGKDKQGLSAG